MALGGLTTFISYLITKMLLFQSNLLMRNITSNLSYKSQQYLQHSKKQVSKVSSRHGIQARVEIKIIYSLLEKNICIYILFLNKNKFLINAFLDYVQLFSKWTPRRTPKGVLEGPQKI